MAEYPEAFNNIRQYFELAVNYDPQNPYEPIVAYFARKYWIALANDMIKGNSQLEEVRFLLYYFIQ